MKIPYQLLDPTCFLTRGSEQAAGWDAKARLAHPICLQPMQRMAVPLGIILEMTKGWECQVRPRSGLAIKHGVTVLNSPGTIDADFRGECGAILINLSNEPFVIHPGDRICQLVFATVPNISLEEIAVVNATSRGAQGFGSSGVH